MSFSNFSSGGPSSFSSTRSRNPSKIRGARLAGSPVMTPPTSVPSSPATGSIGAGSFGTTRSLAISAPSTSLHSSARGATIFSPSVFYRFPMGCEPSLIAEVTLPNNAVPFSTQPPTNLVNPSTARFLIYAIASTPVSTAPVKFILNNQVISHWVTDPRPIDVTQILAPFGAQNWLILDTANFIAPFSVVGVWADYLEMSQIIDEVKSRGVFQYTCLAEICPITQQSIQIPAKGVGCRHDSCFDFCPFITVSQATGAWVCPICRAQLNYESLRIGEKPAVSLNLPTDNSISSGMNMWGNAEPTFEETPFWGGL